LLDTGYFLYENSFELFWWIMGAAAIMLLAGRYYAGRVALIALYFITLLLIFTQIFILFNDLSSDHPSWLYLVALIIPFLIFYEQNKFSKTEANGKIILYGLFTGMNSSIIVKRLIYYHFPGVEWGLSAWHVCTLSGLFITALLFYSLVFYFFRETLTWKKILLTGLAGGIMSMVYYSVPAISAYIKYYNSPFGSNIFEESPVSHQLAWRTAYFVFPQIAAAFATGCFFILCQRKKKADLH
jgi:hypothetical protein